MPTPADIIAMIILSYFPTVECLALPPPSSDENITQNISENEAKLSQAFTARLQETIRYVLENVTTKKGFATGAKVDGTTLVLLAEQYIKAINTPGQIPSLDNTWHAVVEQKITALADQLVGEYEKEMEVAVQDNILEEQTLMEVHHHILEAKQQILREETHRLMPPDPSEDATSLTAKKEEVLHQFQHHIVEYGKEERMEGEKTTRPVRGGILFKFLQANYAKSLHACEILFDKLFSPINEKISTAIGENIGSYKFSDLVRDIKEMRNTYDDQAIGPAKHAVYTQKKREVLDHRMETFKQMVDFSERLVKALNHADEAKTEAATMRKDVQNLQNSLEANEREIMHQVAEHERVIREVREKEKEALGKEFIKQKDLMESHMHEAVSASEEKCKEVQETCEQQIKIMEEAQRRDQRRYDAEVERVKKGIVMILTCHEPMSKGLRKSVGVPKTCIRRGRA